ncbi:MAG TPA: hypothetical protein VNK52_15355 [Hyphomicrobiaceae bacterium]|nr:hypothetical protein [Hyphomicrobiaceae bacterium]
MAEARRGVLTSWGRAADYLFGRNALIGVAVFMLLAISGYATWHGMRDFIIGVSAPPSVPSGPGGLSVSTDLLVIVVVVALTFLMWLALRETFGVRQPLRARLVMFPLYLFLALWSIGFGYGFWWSLIAGEEATRTSLSSLQEDARDAAAAVAARLDAVRSQLDAVVTWSESQMSREETSGGSCGPPSGAGRGPLYNARRSVRDAVASLRDNISRSWVAPVQADLELLQKSAAAIEGETTQERQRLFEARASEIRGRARSIAARSNELGRSTAAEMRALAAAVSIAPGQQGFSCYDPTLASRLRQAADQAAQPAELRLRQAVFTEGPAGVANAVKNLWTNVGAYLSSLATYIATGGAETGDVTAEGEPITGRDMIALLATIGIDLGLLALALINPPSTVHWDALSQSQARLHLPTASVVRHLTSAFQTAIARAPGADLEWVRRHFIHHDGHSYFVIPNLWNAGREDGEPKEEVKKANEREELRALAMNQLAGVFSDLKLVRPVPSSELKRLAKEEGRHSLTDLTPYRHAPEGEAGKERPGPGRRGQRIRNHGLLSKAQRALDIAGWSERAQRDTEIFQLVDVEGLTPLLAVLNDGAQPARGEEGHSDGSAAPVGERPA